MDATGTASMAAAAGFVWTAARFGWARLDNDLQARAAARQRAQWEQHSTCMQLRSAGGCLGLTTHEKPARVRPEPAPAPAPAPEPVESVPDYVPEYVVGQVVRDLLHERGAS